MTDNDPWGDLTAPPPVPQAPPAPEPQPMGRNVTVATSGITMTLDLHQLVTAIDPQGGWLGYDPEADEDRFEPASLTDKIIHTTSLQLVKAMRDEVRKLIQTQVSEAIRAEVVALVREVLVDGQLQETGDFGRVIGEPRPLKEVIVATATTMLTKPIGDSYHNGNRKMTPLQTMIETEVGAAFKKELGDVVAQAKRAALDAVQANAAAVIRETIERSARGLS